MNDNDWHKLQEDLIKSKYHYFHTDRGVLLCGNCLDVLRVLPNESIDLIFTSPPYFVRKDYEAKEKTPEAYQTYLNLLLNTFSLSERILVNGGNLYIDIDDSHTSLKSVFKKSIVLPTHAHLIVNLSQIFDYKEMILWKKIRGKHATGGAKRLLGSYGRFRSPACIPIVQECEYILWFRKRGKRRDVTDELRKASALTPEEFKEFGMQIWEIQPERTRTFGHPTPFPITLANRIIKIGSFVHDVVLDMFCGSGTTPLACEQLNRKWIAIDINRDYCDITKKRVLEYVKQRRLC